MICRIAGQRGAERSADTNRTAGNPKSQIETAGAARQVGNDQRQSDPHDCRRDAIEHLHSHDSIRVCHQRECDPPRDQCREADA
jgi:hypothetical protein